MNTRMVVTPLMAVYHTNMSWYMGKSSNWLLFL